MSTRAVHARTAVITPRSDAWLSRVRELWRLRDVLYFLVWRDIKVRYKQTALGATWAVLQPLLTMIVFSVFLGRVANVQTGLPYPLFAYTGLVLWQSFATGVTNGSMSLVANAVLVTKVYVPRTALVLAPILAAVVDFVVSLPVLTALMGWYGTAPDLQVLLAPLFVAAALLTALATSLWLAALNVKYRDVRYVIPFLLQIWLFATPIAYSADFIHGYWEWIYGLNPMAGVVEGFRWAVVGGGPLPLPTVAVSLITIAVILASGAAYFHRAEKSFADVI